jgi:hypothetical protein
MATQMEKDATAVLRFVAATQHQSAEGPRIQDGTGLPPERINDAVALLEMNGYAEVMKWMGTVPFEFGQIDITPLGRFELQSLDEPENGEPAEAQAQPASVARSPIPRGSPYGFEAQDWEFVETELSRRGLLKVVLGHPWESEHFDVAALKANLETQFADVLAAYESEPGSDAAALDFVPLKGGYGEHLFNEIARDIISADIAIFDTSDLNSNVMIEMGVALTWVCGYIPFARTELLSLRQTSRDRRGRATPIAEPSG